MSQSIKYFLYIRKSTDDKTHQVLSLSRQTEELRSFTKREGISIYETLEESRSAKVPGRPVFNEMLDRIESGEANGILCWDIDRLYRNPIDEGRARWLLQNSVIKAIRTPTRQFLPDDAGLLMGVEGGRATDYIIRLVKNVRSGVEEKLRRGEWPGSKPLGFIYDRNLRNIVPDPHKWKIALTIFEEYAEGRHGLTTAAERLFTLGVTSRSGKQWSKYAIWQFLTNPLYIGIMEWGGKTYEGKFKTFIPPTLFNRVQAVLKTKSKPRKVRHGHNFPFCGLFRCTCGSMMTAQWAKGNGGTYCYYRCSRKAGECSEPYIQDKAVIDQCLAFVKPIGITTEQAQHLHGLIDVRMNENGAVLQSTVTKLNESLVTIQEKLNKLTRGYLDGVIDEDSYQSATKDLLMQKTALKKEKERIQRTRASAWIEPVKRLVTTLEMALKSQSDKSPPEIAAIVHKVGTNRLIARKTVSFSLAPPYDFIPSLLASRQVTNSHSSPLLSDEHLVSSIWCARVDFNRDIQPIMADTCFRCHGFDEKARKAKLRLDIREEALKPTKSGDIPILPGKPDQSEVIRRLSTEDADDRMPPESIHKPLTKEQREVFRRWIAEGAEYRDHWAFIPPRPVDPPKVKHSGWQRNEVDRFILAQLETKKLKPSREADATTLIRRVSLDLTGIPPTPAEVQSFVADQSPQAYEKLVDRLLASPRYGERMAQDWLDAARFADSNGYQVDRDREMWAWREWVIKAFNHNQPFDEFTIEQLAGDLLPHPTLDQRIATGFHRNHMINEEGGIIPEEFLAEYCADRVETTSTVFLGLTMGCARCHDHKYDPLTQKDYYSMFAFFHNVTEKGIGDYGQPIRRNTPPYQKLPTPEAEAKLAGLNRELAAANERLTNLMTTFRTTDLTEWESRARTAVPVWSDAEPLNATAGNNSLMINQPGGWVRSPSLKPDARKAIITARVKASPLSAIQLDLAAPQASGTNDSEKLSIRTVRFMRAETPELEKKSLSLRPTTLAGTAPVVELAKVLDDKESSTWSITLKEGQTRTGVFELSDIAQAGNGVLVKLEVEFSGERLIPAWQLRLRTTDIPSDLLLPPEILTIVTKPAAERKTDENKLMDDFRLAHYPEHSQLTQRVAELKKQIDEADLAIPITLVMEELAETRPTYVLMRGTYDKPGERVTATTPSHLPAFLSEQPTNRLGLARWLVSPNNPLTARVTVNRFWQSVFGTGLVKTSEDFGTRGELPSHPELLDWLANEFVRTGWDVKIMMKLLVTSATYRQDSRVTPTLYSLDPDNRLLARGPRYRLSAELIRDQALAASGLLVEKLGGPSVKPYHPPGLYEQVVSGSSANTYVQDKGESLYRRSLYTYWKRSVPNPAMLIFDAPFREACTVRRSRTTTPLQALNLLNDPTYVEASRFLAQRMLREGGSKPESRIRLGFQLATGRQPRTPELRVLVKGWQRMETSFRSDRSGAESLLTVGETKNDGAFDPVELAAYATVASTLLNLDETITKQ